MAGADECRLAQGSPASGPEKKKLCKWTDASGTVYYSDSDPVDFNAWSKGLGQGQAASAGDQCTTDVLEKLAAIARQTYLESEERTLSAEDRRAELFAAQSRKVELHIRTLERQLAALEVAEYVPECEEVLRHQIRDLRETIELYRRSPDHSQDHLERIQDGPGQNQGGEESASPG